ncbi:hypothetical protein GA0111570_10273 [Raineyella antarctica]|uniref:Uncharacterized protein n=1 Tax=Raineyella antarctica TaxID=1577474 RepID=A0A1G6GE91_9ACTN|nr:hypothetical protein [Raineyella antarctica]SDB80287.1 hypothetical protein GA0111570_10273 [Raineyella antarctica]
MTLRMTLQDIAELAHVQRPVVSMWRKRGTPAIAFPGARRDPDGQERFAVDDVVAYLEATGRGNNPEVRADAAAYAMWSGTAAEREATAQALSALLTLRKLVGHPLQDLDAEEILDLADEADPDDDFLLAELESRTDLVRDAATAEALVEAAWDVERAHARVLDERFRAAWRPLADSAVSPSARALVRALIGALARDLGEDCPVTDPTGCGADLLLEAVEGGDHPVLLRSGEGDVARLTQRLLALAGRRYGLVRPGEAWAGLEPVVHLLTLPAADDLDAAPDRLWDLVDELDLQLAPGQRGLVLAPAALLTDPLPEPQEVRRDQLLRSGRVRVAVRLPAGLRTSRPREHLAFWVLADPDTDTLAERRTGIADLAELALDAPTVSGLVDDVLACLHGIEAARRRSWAHLAWLPTADLVARRGSLVAGVRHSTVVPRGVADRVLEVRTALEAAGLAGRVSVEAAPDEARTRGVTLGAALDRGHLRHLPGQRLELADLPAGQLAVAVPDQARGGWQVYRLDRLTLALGRDLRQTEPGDIVATVRPAPDAWVDEQGGTVVVMPGFILRPRAGGPLGAHAVAETIRSQDAGRTRWRDWVVPQPPADQRAVLESVLTAMNEERDALRRRLAGLDRAARLLTETIGTGHARFVTPAPDLPPTPNEGA